MFDKITTPTNMRDLVQSISVQVSGSTKFSKFQRMYEHDRIAFAYDCMGELGKSMTFYQEEILGYFDNGNHRVAVRGPHGLGKTFIAALLVHHAVLTASDDCKVITTASAWRQVEKYLWPEIKKLGKGIDWDYIGRSPYDPNHEFLQMSIKLQGGVVEAFAVVSDDFNTIEGAHAKKLIYIFDEAKSIPRNTWNAAEGAFANAYSGKVNQTFNYDDINTEDIGLIKGDHDLFQKTLIPSEITAHKEDAIVSIASAWDSINNPGTDSEDGNEYEDDIDVSSIKNSNQDFDDVEDKYENMFETAYDKSIKTRGKSHETISTITGQVISNNGSEVIDNKQSNSDTNQDVIDVVAEDYMQGSIEEHDNSKEGTVSLDLMSDAVGYKSYVDTIKKQILGQQGASGSASVLRPTHPHDKHVLTALPTKDHDIRIPLRSNTKDHDTTTNIRVTDEAYAFAISTPGNPDGQFYDIHMHKAGYEDWTTKHVTLEDSIVAGRISAEWAKQRARQWGTTSALYLNRVLGEFADETEEGMIPLSWVRAAFERWKSWRDSKFAHDSSTNGTRTIGVDVARGGDDKTVLACREGCAISKIYVYSKLSTTATAARVTAIHEGRSINIEMDGGLGASVYDMLREDGITGLRPITVSAPTIWKDRSKEMVFYNVRAAMWWNIRQLLDPEWGSSIMLPPIDELALDLTTPHYEVRRNNTIVLESKDSIRERLGRSTDYGDAVCLAFWKSNAGGGVVV
jgi:hypothetical protein